MSVTSDDGALTVTVPAGAGPADVTITAIDPPPEFADLEGASVIAAYELGPEGAEFSEPVALEFQAPLADSAEIPLLLPTISRTDGDGFELLEDLELIVGDSTVAIRGTTRHFSRLLIGRSPELSGISLSPTELNLAVGRSGRFEALASACNGCTLIISEVSDNPGHVSVALARDRFATVTCKIVASQDVGLQISVEVTLGDALQLYLRGGTFGGYANSIAADVDTDGPVNCFEEGPISLSLDALTMIYAERVISGLPTEVDEAAATVTVTAFGVEVTDGGLVFSGTFQEPVEGSGTILVEVERADGSLAADWFLGFDLRSDGSFEEFAESLFYGLDGGTIPLQPPAGDLDGGFRVEVPLEVEGRRFYAQLLAENGEQLDPPRIEVDGLFLTFTVDEDGAAWKVEVDELVDSLPEFAR